MIRFLTPLALTTLCVVPVLLTGPSGAVTIYRFGGEWLPPPAESELPGVDFRQLSWADIGDAGAATRLRIGRGIMPIEYTASAPLSLFTVNHERFEPLFDRNEFVCGLCDVHRALGYVCGFRTSLCRGSYGLQGTINIALGDRVLVDEVRIHSGDRLGTGILADFGLTLSTRALGEDREILTPFTVEVRDNRESELRLTGLPSQVRSAAVQLALAEHEHPVTLREIEVYARGPASRGEYISDIIDFGRPAVWGGLRWDLRPGGSRAVVATRAGEGGDQLVYWKYTGIGDTRVEVSREEYEDIRSTLRAGTSYNYDGWTGWSAEGNLADTTVEPPLPITPHRAFQLLLRFDTEGDAASALDVVEFRASVPAVSLLLGELDPIEVVAGEVTDFTYTLKPRVEPTDTGFDRIQVSAVAARFEQVVAVSIEDRAVPFTVESLSDQRLVIAVPRVGLDQADAIVQLRFRARALRFGASFAGHVVDSQRPYDLSQPVQPGDAVDEIFSDRLWIETTVRVRSVLTAAATPRVITPNGDGVGDEARISYDVVETTGLVPIDVVVHDLAGRRVRALHEGREDIGHYERLWDGRDDAGRLVPPGVYLFRATARIGDDRFDRIGTIHVAY